MVSYSAFVLILTLEHKNQYARGQQNTRRQASDVQTTNYRFPAKGRAGLPSPLLKN